MKKINNSSSYDSKSIAQKAMQNSMAHIYRRLYMYQDGKIVRRVELDRDAPCARCLGSTYDFSTLPSIQILEPKTDIP